MAERRVEIVDEDHSVRVTHGHTRDAVLTTGDRHRTVGDGGSVKRRRDLVRRETG